MFCGKCGKQLNGTESFCTGCGSPVKKKETPVPEAVTPVTPPPVPAQPAPVQYTAETFVNQTPVAKKKKKRSPWGCLGFVLLLLCFTIGGLVLFTDIEEAPFLTDLYDTVSGIWEDIRKAPDQDQDSWAQDDPSAATGPEEQQTTDSAPTSAADTTEATTETTQHIHTWEDATCAAPKTCSSCGEISGTALDHQWTEATYSTPKTCTLCGSVEGEAKQLLIGEIITLGQYEQDCNMDEAEPINWMVLDIQGSQALVITEDIIECMMYHDTYEPITWADCTSRKWLNGDFYSGAFTKEEKDAILLTTVQTPDNTTYNTTGGIDTYDYLYLLSRDEVERYFSQKEVSKESKATDYILSKGAGSLGKSVYWWIRTPGRIQETALVADCVDTAVFSRGNSVNCWDNTIRPVMWIDLDKLP